MHAAAGIRRLDAFPVGATGRIHAGVGRCAVHVELTTAVGQFGVAFAIFTDGIGAFVAVVGTVRRRLAATANTIAFVTGFSLRAIRVYDAAIGYLCELAALVGVALIHVEAVVVGHTRHRRPKDGVLRCVAYLAGVVWIDRAVVDALTHKDTVIVAIHIVAAQVVYTGVHRTDDPVVAVGGALTAVGDGVLHALV